MFLPKISKRARILAGFHTSGGAVENRCILDIYDLEDFRMACKDSIVKQSHVITVNAIEIQPQFNMKCIQVLSQIN